MSHVVDENHDYQNEMTTDTRAIDTAGEEAAAEVNAQTQPVGTQTVRTDMGNNQTRVDTMGTFGVLPAMVIPPEHARERMMWFKDLAMETGARKNPFNPFAAVTETAAYKSQINMAKAYMADEVAIMQAQQSYDALVPQTEIAARSLAKTNEIGSYTGLSDRHGPALDNREGRALSEASRKFHTPLENNQSMAAASKKLIIAREEMFAKSSRLASVANDHVVQVLLKDYGQAKAGREAMAAKIAKAQRIVGIFSNAAAAVVGGAALVHNEISAGAPGTEARAKADYQRAPIEGPVGPKPRTRVKWPRDPHEPAESHDESHITDADLRGSSVPTIEAVGESAGRISGHTADIVAFGLTLYHARDMDRLESQMEVAQTLLDAKSAEKARLMLNAAFIEFNASQMAYGEAAEAYQAVMNDRRKDMAMLGTAADRIADPSGTSSKASDAMLWTASVMESRSFVSTALDFGTRAYGVVDNAYVAMRTHRQTPWGTLEDMHGAMNLPRTEGLTGADVVSLRAMRQLVANFNEGSEAVVATLGSVSEEQAKPVLNLVGFTGRY